MAEFHIKLEILHIFTYSIYCLSNKIKSVYSRKKYWYYFWYSIYI